VPIVCRPLNFDLTGVTAIHQGLVVLGISAVRPDQKPNESAVHLDLACMAGGTEYTPSKSGNRLSGQFENWGVSMCCCEKKQIGVRKGVSIEANVDDLLRAG
jgi:hypothetical protein